MKTKVISIRLISLMLLLSFLLLGTSHAQVNLVVGYELNRFSSSVNSELTKSFNEVENPFLSNGKELGQLQYLNGLTVGISYKTTGWRSEVGFKTSSRSRDAFGEIPATTTEPASSFEVDMRYRIAGFYLSSEFLANRFGIGASLGSDAFRLTSNIVDSSNDKVVTNQLLYSARLHLSYQVYQSSNMELVIRPYFKSYLKAVNHTEVYHFLGLSETIALVDRPYSIGFSLLFYNGAQN